MCLTLMLMNSFFCHVAGRACAEYIVEIARTGTTYRAPAQFISSAEHNLSFALVVHFLYDYLFLFMQARNSVRTCDSHMLDLIWCEALAMLRTGGKAKYS